MSDDNNENDESIEPVESSNGPADTKPRRTYLAPRVVGIPFAKGKSGNPLGRPRDVAEVRELAREFTVEAINALVEIVTRKKSSDSAKITAAIALLDRGWGKPQSQLEVQTDGSPVNVGVLILPPVDGE